VSIDKSLERRPRIGVYIEGRADDEKQDQHLQNLMEALQSCVAACGEKYDIYVYSSKKRWKKYSKDYLLTYRPFPISGSSNALGGMLIGKEANCPKPPEWVGEMLNRKSDDFRLELMIFATPTSLVKDYKLPNVVVLDDMLADEDSEHDAEWYKDLYHTALKYADLAIVDPTEDVDQLIESLVADIENPAEIKRLSLGSDLEADPEVDLQELKEGLSSILIHMLAKHDVRKA